MSQIRFPAAAVLGLLLLPVFSSAQGLSPEAAVKRMKLPDGFQVRAVAAEPMIRQPLSVSFDERGRMWVLQYLQYPNPNGLKALKQDQYLRTVWDKVPEPPPRGPKGIDTITILSDPDENGVYRKSKNFLNDLNLATGFCLGHGGVYVVQPPYLLFYADKNADDLPDGDPQVLLTGFGMEDTHSYANSLQWGPDGWLYGAHGSTVTAKIRNPAEPNAPEVEFQQGIWRFHPLTKKFELFSEGGGNTYGLDFDKNGQAIAGTNYGGKAMLHQLQGAYYVKGFSKHGPLHNPNTYGFFEHVPYKDFKGGHVTCGGIMYQAEAFPPEYRDQYIAGNLLSNAVYMHKMKPVGSSFTAEHGSDLMTTDDTWFRPVDLFQGPDGSVYVADWTDKRAAHLDPVDNWDKTNGRVFRIEYKGTPKLPAFDLRTKSSAELIELLKNPNKWWRNEARRLLAERRDASVVPTLKKWVADETGLLALEALWAINVSGGFDEAYGRELLTHPNERVREWAVRLVGDRRTASPETYEAWESLAGRETVPTVLAQLACTAKRLDHDHAVGLARQLVKNPVSATDAQLPLLIWWAIEGAMTDEPDVGLTFALESTSKNPLYQATVTRIVRRLLATDVKKGPESLARLLTAWSVTDPTPVLKGMAEALEGSRLERVPAPLVAPFAKLRETRPNDELLLEVMARMNDPAGLAILRGRVSDAKLSEPARLKAAKLLTQVRDPECKVLLLNQLERAKSDAFRVGVLVALGTYDDPAIGETVLAGMPSWSAAVKKQAFILLTSRPAWALTLMNRIEAGKLPKDAVSLETARTAVGLNDAHVTKLVEKHYGKLAPATAGEKQARIAWLNRELTVGGTGNAVAGKALFAKTCAACHQIFGEGGKVGPDLTTADRKNRGYMLAQIVDPSGYIRPEYVVHSVTTADGRRLSGIVVPAAGETVTLLNVIDNKPLTAVVAKSDIEDMKPSAISLMPEKLLDTISYQDVRDLFAYLASEGPSTKETKPSVPPARPQRKANAAEPKVKPGTAKKLKVCLVSGSFEYKSDDSLAGFQTYLEKNFPVECSRAFAKSETEIGGLDNLATADVAIFFTRRLKIDGPELEKVKKYVQSGKPIVGIRTASHGFQNWLDMDKLVYGGDYKNHLRAGTACVISTAEKAKGHAVLEGVGTIKSDGTLYRNPAVAADVTVLLNGTVGTETYPVAWLREKEGQRIFYTSLGHPVDFKDEHFVRLLLNGLAWASKTELKPAK